MHPQFPFQFFPCFSLTHFFPPTMWFCLLSTKSWPSPCHHGPCDFTSRSFVSFDRSPAIPSFDHRGHPPSLSHLWAPSRAPPWDGGQGAAVAPTATNHRARGPWWKRSVSRKLRSVCPEHKMEKGPKVLQGWDKEKEQKSENIGFVSSKTDELNVKESKE